jgi:coproporphyrinogen III oxidase-like Fe-S oxidoreductase
VSELARRLAAIRDRLALGGDVLDELGLVFEPIEPEAHRDSLRRFVDAASAGRVPRELILYVHVPYCARLCGYCLLAARKAPARRRIAGYVHALRAEIADRAALLGDLPVTALHVGGGTPTLLEPEELDVLLNDLAQLGRRQPGFRIGFEGHPATTTPDKLAVLARHGVRRISLGVESFTPEVLARVGRGDQSAERVARAVRAARAAGLAVNLDLLAGLPGETLASFTETVERALALEPSSLSVNRFLVEKSALGAQGHAPDTGLCDEMLLAADRRIREASPVALGPKLTVPGYGTQYNFVRDDVGYFQQDMIGPTTIVALGHGGLGHLYAGYFYTAAGTPDDWVRARQAGREPELLAARVSLRFEQAFFVADRATRGELYEHDFARAFGQALGDVFAAELAFLGEAGLLERRGERWVKPARRDFQVTHLLALLAGASPCKTFPAQLAQYREVPGELPPSLVWCRIAMRADATNRRLSS